MKYQKALLQLGCFTLEDAVALTGSVPAAKSMLQYYTSHQAVMQVRRGLYAAINPLDGEPLADRYRVASKLSPTAVVSHHSAFEYHGYTNQVFYRTFVSSESKFNSFSFGGYSYVRMPSSMSLGIEVGRNGERVTDIERTLLDSVNDFERTCGFEELIQCISLISVLNEQKLTDYLKVYRKRFLYQKVGFILEHFRDNFDLSDCFFEMCHKNAGNSSRYLIKGTEQGEMEFSNAWQLTYPKDLWRKITGGDENADI